MTTINSRFKVSVMVQNGHPHYVIHDTKTDNEIHCEFGELNETIWELEGI